MTRTKKTKKERCKDSFFDFEEFEPMESVALEPYDRVVYEAVCEAYSTGMYTNDRAFSFDAKRPTISFKTIYELMERAGKTEEEYQQEENKIKKSLERLMSKMVRIDLSEEVRKATKDDTVGIINTGHLLESSLWQKGDEPWMISLHSAPSFGERKKQEAEKGLLAWFEMWKEEYGE